MIINLVSFINRNILSFLLIFFLIHLAVFWPGILTGDSQAQYESALTGVYYDHHPPIMAFIWHLLLYIYPGSGLMLFFHMLLLYGSVYYLLQCFPVNKRFLGLIFPLIPSIFVYSGFIWKDVGFAFSFLFVGAVLAALQAEKKPLKWTKGIFLGIVTFYGTAVKYQAQFCTPLLLLWVVYIIFHLNRPFNFKKSIQYFLIIGGIIYSGLYWFKAILVLPINREHSWQYVKVFDLAAMSVVKNQCFLPDFIKTPSFSMDKLKEKFNAQKVDPLIFGQEAILKCTPYSMHHQQLKKQWLRTVFCYPLIYLKQRFSVLGGTLFSPIGENIETFQYSSIFIKKIVIFLYKILKYTILSHFLQILISFLYFCLGVRTLHLTNAAIPLVFFNGMGMVLISVLLFCSMAGAPRYTYAAICFFHASHIFAYRCYHFLKANRKGNFLSKK